MAEEQKIVPDKSDNQFQDLKSLTSLESIVVSNAEDVQQDMENHNAGQVDDTMLHTSNNKIASKTANNNNSASSQGNKSKNGNKKKKKPDKTKVTLDVLNPQNEQDKMPQSQGTERVKYKKKPGTSGIKGSLYKTNILSLMLYRSLNDPELNNFVLGCSVEGIGNMSDICYRFQQKNTYNTEVGKPVVVFIKTKFTEKSRNAITDDDLKNEKSPFYLYNCLQSFLKIKEKFDECETDPLFEGSFDDVIPYFVIYTPHESEISNPIINDKLFDDKVFNIINADSETKTIYKIQSDVMVDLVSKLINDRMYYIATTIADYVTPANKNDEKTANSMRKVLQEYYSFLVPNVIKIHEANGDYFGEFNKEFLFESNEKYYLQFKTILFREVLLKTAPNVEEAKKNLMLLLEYNVWKAGHISHLIGNVIEFNEQNNKFEFMVKALGDETYEYMKQKLESLVVNKSILIEARDKAGRRTLESITGIDLNNSNIKQDISRLFNLNATKTLDYFQNEKNNVSKFADSLYFYTEQGNKNEISKQLLKKITDDVALEKNNESIFHCKPELLYLKLHYKVQKWFLEQGESCYQTNTCDFFKDIANIMKFTYLNLLNYKCAIELEKFSLSFKKASTQYLSKLGGDYHITNIVSDSIILTSVKLLQFFAYKYCSFMNLTHVISMKDVEFIKLLQEISSTTIETLVIIIDKEKLNIHILKQIMDRFLKSVVIISDCELTDTETLKINVLYDDKNALIDIENVNDILKYQITVQGIEDELESFLEANTKTLINSGTLIKILKNETIEVGRNLSNPFYEELKKYFVERYIRSDEFEHTESIFNKTTASEYKLSTFKDIDDAVVLITAKPGMGKSTLLTHLSVNTKKYFPKTWIVRMNLLDYCEEFSLWQEKNTFIDLEESIRLVCKAEVGINTFDKLSLKVINRDLTLVNSEFIGMDLLNVQLFIDCFNNGHVIFLFDGFDEVCPHYEIEVVQFMKNLVGLNVGCSMKNKNSKDNHAGSNQIWITSRPYNAIKRTLVREFASPFYLRRLSTLEQTVFYQSYWETHLKLENLNSEQLKNIDAFFEYMSQYQHHSDKIFKVPTPSSVPLRLMHEAAVDFFRGKILTAAIDVNKEALLKKWISRQEIQTVDDCVITDDQYEEALHLAGIPLHMHIYADHFVNEILETSSTKNWETGIHTFEFYERFLETKLKKIRFEEKNREDVYTAANRADYDKEKKKFTDKHKLLAFYAFFHDSQKHYKKVLSKSKWQKIKNMIERVAKGEEKTGLIDRIYRGVPRFVHLVFAEYFAVEYIADMVKSTQSDTQMRKLIDFILNCLLRSSEGIMTVFDHKLKHDKHLQSVFERDAVRRYIFNIWMEQDGSTKTIVTYYGTDTINLVPCIEKVLENGLIESAWFLLRSIAGNLNKDNIEAFIKFTCRDIFILALDYDEITHFVLNSLREIDPSMIEKVYSICGLDGDVQTQTNEVILELLRDKFKNPVQLDPDVNIFDALDSEW